MLSRTPPPVCVCVCVCSCMYLEAQAVRARLAHSDGLRVALALHITRGREAEGGGGQHRYAPQYPHHMPGWHRGMTTQRTAQAQPTAWKGHVWLGARTAPFLRVQLTRSSTLAGKKRKDVLDEARPGAVRRVCDGLQAYACMHRALLLLGACA